MDAAETDVLSIAADPDAADDGTLPPCVECAGRTATDVLKEVETLLRHATAGGRTEMVLADVGHLAGSASALMKGLVRLLADHPGGVTFKDRSGFIQVLMNASQTFPGPDMSDPSE